MNRIILIRTSLSIFTCGVAGLIPLFGIVPAVYAVVSGIRLNLSCKNEWNPASGYLNWGITLALLSLSLNLLIGAVFILELVPPYVEG